MNHGNPRSLFGLWKALEAQHKPGAMCAGALSHAPIGRVVWGADDPKGGAVVHGPRLFDQPTLHWRPLSERGPLADESALALRTFFRARRGTPV